MLWELYLPRRVRRLSISEKPRRKRHSPERIVRKPHDADAMLNAGKDPASVPQSLEVSEATPHRWRAQYGSMEAEERAPGRSRGWRLKELEDENERLKRLLAD
jgi:putative transposase